ncbi:uncharacterized protein HaLaN_21320 [Haematococcus lacustris]|uniref:DUF952 domain-containing protein n=1 Tax=Haematococcus lacustris TaxID=44745 RepID=A0A6A0A2L6_HAELA|nr:uncharacterized protein HaLaN_21320 [Haematococcus lacustris]
MLLDNKGGTTEASGGVRKAICLYMSGSGGARPQCSARGTGAGAGVHICRAPQQDSDTGRLGRMYHMTAKDLWESAVASQRPYFPPTYEQDGFIHLTSDPALLLTVANHFYTSSPHKDWVVLTLDPSRLTAKVVFEAAAPVGATPTFTTASDAAPANPVAAVGSAGAAAGEQAAAQAPPATATTAGSTVEQAAAVVGGASSAVAGEQAESKPVLFPHLYGTIDYDAVIATVQMVRDKDSGAFLAIPGLA